ncbi:MAG: NAD(P)/FAD-dependent oxidoreductase [Caldilineaceae bacterium]|nr:NAD(P)/FAD-dependent oxidoreductase [Caldilineaceae bacterium]
MKRVIIIGVGFGGINAARTLAGQGLDVLLLDRNNYHLFQPLLYQVATAGLEQEAIAFPVRALIRGWAGVRFHRTEVTGIDLAQRQVQTTGGAHDYDYLVVAAGSETNYFGLERVQQAAYDLKQLNDAAALRNHILTLFERAAHEHNAEKRQALLTFVVVGGGPTGVEFAGALAELSRLLLRSDFPELEGANIRILLAEAADSLLLAMPKRLQEYARRRLEKMGVEVLTGAVVADATEVEVRLNDGRTIAAHTLLWSAGVRPAGLAAAIDAPRARGGRIIVQPDLSLAGRPEVFVIGDLAYLEQEGKPLPMMAPVAIQMGQYVGRAIVRLERDQALEPFCYFDKGSMATIGRNAAVANAFGVKLAGFPAWVAWLALHLYYLIGFRNRLVVLLNWAYDYFLFERQIRLITHERKVDKAAIGAPRTIQG